MSDCAICLQEVEAGFGISLPCACNDKQTYHPECWEHWVAQELRCPTCKSYIDVEAFDLDNFKPSYIVEPSQGEKTRVQMTRKIRALEDKMRGWTNDAQLTFLKQPLGGHCCSSSGGDDCAEASQFRCVCGGELEKIGFDARRGLDGNRFKGYICDMCQSSIRAETDMYLWTCAKKTVVHPRGYDICVQCIQKHCQPPAKQEPDVQEEEPAVDEKIQMVHVPEVEEHQFLVEPIEEEGIEFIFIEDASDADADVSEANAAAASQDVVHTPAVAQDSMEDWKRKYESTYGTCPNVNQLIAFARHRGGRVSYQEARRALQ